MPDYRKQFTYAMSFACQGGVTHGRLVRHRHLRDIENAIFAQSRTPQEIAAMALDQLCEGDKSPEDMTVFSAVGTFLNTVVQDIGLESDKAECYRVLYAAVSDGDKGYDEILKTVNQIWP